MGEEERRARTAATVSLQRTRERSWGANGRWELAATTSTTESISNLTSSINGPLQYLRAKPTALFVRPSASSFDAVQSLPPVHLTLANGGNLDGIPLGEDDLASFLFPRILRATASLEAALICTPYPIDGATDEASQLWRDRLELRLKLEDLLATVVGVLAESAVRVEWKGKDSPAEGGIGKAREMTSDMLKLLRGESSAQVGAGGD